MGGCGGNKSAKTNSYTPKKIANAPTTGGRRTSGNPFATRANGFGTPSVKMSFSSRNRNR